MSVETKADGDVIHYPKRKDVFEFDADVASHFDQMAVRSIPMYAEAHRLHVALLKEYLQPGTVVADIGSSTGNTFRAIEAGLGAEMQFLGIKGYAVDNSPAMMERLSAEFPGVEAYTCDIARAPDLPEPVNIMFAYYLLQFLPALNRSKALAWMHRNIKPGGWLVLGQKDMISPDSFKTPMDQEYYRFRMANGYTLEEIEAKTLALKNSMWPVPPEFLNDELTDLGFTCRETSRWLMFSTTLARKRG